MRVLDIDLDAFLTDTCPLAEPGRRPEESCAAPWDQPALVQYLSTHLCLSPNHPIPGRVFETHDGALMLWHELVLAGKLTTPFHVTHVDAHSDLGIGAPGPGLVLHGALCERPEIRRDPQRHKALGQLDEANYLLFALAYRYVASLDNVRNPRSKPDLPEEIVSRRNPDGSAAALRLVPPMPMLFEGRNGREPEIPYLQFDDPYNFVADAQYDFVSLAISPRYAPASADTLIPLFEACMTPI